MASRIDMACSNSERACFLHAIYGGRWDDPAEYDRVFSVTGQTVDQEVQAVISALSARIATDEGRAALHLRVAAARVKAGIATNSAFLLPVFDVLPDGAGLVLRGVTHTPKEHRRIEEAAREVSLYAEHVEFDPMRLEVIGDRLELIQKLKKKYGGTIADISAFGEKAAEELTKIEHSGEEAERLRKEIAGLRDRITAKARELTKRRTAAATSNSARKPETDQASHGFLAGSPIAPVPFPSCVALSKSQLS
jgi:hypothetical protein